MLSILYVDDEPALLDIAKVFLEKTGDFSVRTTGSAAAALEYLKTNPVDAILADYQMPDIDGIQLLITVRQQFGDIPFILFTGRGREEIVIQAINNGADFYIQKGGDPKAQFAELIHKIRKSVENRQARNAVKDSEQRLADIVDFLPDATFAIDRNGRVIIWNHAIEKMTGVPASDMLGKGEHGYALPFYGTRRPMLIDLINEPEAAIARSYSHVVREDDVLIADTGLPRLKGKPVTLMGMASPLYNRAGEVVGAIESIRDITERKTAEESLLRAKKDWETIFRAIGHPAIVLDAENRIIDANDAALRVTGRSMDELKGKHCYEVFHAPDVDRPPESCPFEQIKRTKKAEAAEMDHETLNGSYHVSCTPVFDDAGRLEKVIHIAMDVTERRHEQDEIAAMYGQLAASEDELRRQLDEISRAQDEKERTEKNFRALVDNAPDAVFIQANNRFLYLNTAALRLFGASSADDLLGKNPWDRIHPSFHAVVRERVHELLAEGRSVGKLDEVYLKLDGSPVDVEVTAVPVQYGSENGVLVMLHDITARKRVETELRAAYEQLTASQDLLSRQYRELEERGQIIRQSEEKYRTLVETTATGFVIVDEQGRVLDANAEYVRLSGHATHDEIFGRSVIEWTADHEREKNAEAVRQCVRDGFIRNFEIDYKDTFGNLTPIEINATVLKSQGRVQILSLCRDISTRRKTQKALRESEEWSRSILDAAQAGILLVDAATHQIIDANPKALNLIGASRNAVIGAVCHRFVCPAERGRCPVTDLCQKVDTSERVLLTASGTQIPVVKTVVPIHIRGRDLLVESFIDISEQKRSEASIREANRKLNLLNSITRHDVANQLTVLRGYTELARFAKPGPVVAEFLAKMADSADTIQRQIDFTRTYQELGTFAPAWQEIGEIIRKVRPGNVTFTTTCDRYEIFADQMLEKVFFNLFDNAVRHGGQVTAITVQCIPADGELIVSVEDNGAGIPLDAKQKIFEHGYGRNTGFGLFLAREILAITGIAIYETGLHGKGARFELHVPQGKFRLKD